MPSYLDQIPKQLAARRKAFAAAGKNPALLPSCWAIVRSIANNLFDYMRNSVVGGCTFPDRPFFLSVDDATFLNFGTTPKLLFRDAAWLEAEKEGREPPEGEADLELAAETRTRLGRMLAGLAATYGVDHRASRVYNLEPWLQDMYRDRLDVDFAEDLQRQIDDLNQYMDNVPRALAATGLSGKIAKGVMDSFNLFKTITGSSHQLDREKMSFVDRRSYVDTIQKIELIMTKADQSLGAAAAGRSVIRELFDLWKDANYEMMALTRQLRALWAGTSLDDRIAELSALLGAVQKTLRRCSEEARQPLPQLPILRADAERDAFVSRAAVAGAFNSLILYDLVVGQNTPVSMRETRKFGPLSVVICPGDGQPRYCVEMRSLGADDEDTRRGHSRSQSRERENDVDRRVRYPMNCLVVPIGSPPETLLEDLADAWLEFNQSAYPVQFSELLEGAKNAAPEAFAPPPEQEGKSLSSAQTRKVLARLVALFAAWAEKGVAPDDAAQPGFAGFREFALTRLGVGGFLIPIRYRPLLDLFSEAGSKRRMEMWKRSLGPRFALDRQLVAVNVLQKDWATLRENLKYLPLSVAKGNSSLDNGFAKTRDASDPFASHKALGFFRKFLTDQPDLKAALVTVESQVAIEVETLRTQSESLGRVFQYDQASETMLQRQASQIQERRNAANAHIDQYLTGLMYALDGNYEAAEGALAMCLTPADRRGGDDAQPTVPDEIGQEWFDDNLRPTEGKFDKRLVPGENGPGTVCYDFIYYNLGIVYLRMNRYIEARMCFRSVADPSSPGASALYRLWGGELSRGAAESMAAGKRHEGA